MKDNFSLQSDQYVKFRPTYPDTLYSFLLRQTSDNQTAWDCATGNGQVAKVLAQHFDKVYGTDISEKQITYATEEDNIIYKIESAENSSFPEHTFDLITVAQAIHWFNFGAFYREVNRTLKPNGILAVIGYGLIQTDKETDKIIDHFYHTIVGPFWDKERKYIDENYETIPFPFKEIQAPTLYNDFQWTLEQLVGYLETWSSVQHFIKANKQNPIDLIYNDLRNSWGNEPLKSIRFPILLRIGKLCKFRSE